MRRFGICFALVAVLWPTFASAHIATYPSRVKRTSIAIEGDTVTKLGGVVRSPRERCVRGRTVVVYFGNTRYGSDTTDTTGKWEIAEDGPTGRTYKYTLYPRRIGQPPHRHVCAAHRFSEVIE